MRSIRLDIDGKKSGVDDDQRGAVTITGYAPERITLADVKRPYSKRGEVPVVFAASSDTLALTDITALCRLVLASYKTHKALYQIPIGDFPCSTSGKVQSHELEAKLRALAPS